MTRLQWSWAASAALHLAPEGSPEALSAAEQAVTLAPGDPEALAALARVQAERGMLDAAAATVEKAHSSSPSNTALLAMAAKLAVRRGRCADARLWASRVQGDQRMKQTTRQTLEADVARCHAEGGAPK